MNPRQPPDFGPDTGPDTPFAREVRSLIADVRPAVLAARGGPAGAAAILSAVPAGPCQRLADIWDAADPDERAPTRDGLSDADRTVLDMVVHACLPARPDSHHEIVLDGLLDHALAGV